MSGIRAILTLALLAIPAAVHAQASAQPGTRVRVTTAVGPRHLGVLQSLSRDSVKFTAENGLQFSLPVAEVAMLEASQGRKRSFWKILGFTTASTTVVGGVIGALTYDPCEPNGMFSCLIAPASPGDAAVVGALGGAAVGIAAGIVAGTMIFTEKWSSVDVRGGQAPFTLPPTIGRGVGFAGTFVLP